MMSHVQLAAHVAFQAHKGQFRRDGVTRYIEHPVRVVKRLRASGYGESVIAAGWLHDVVEDTSWTIEDLTVEGFPEDVLDAVMALTKSPEQSYMEFIEDLSENEIARVIKIADILDNLSDDTTERQIIKYSKALLFLHGQ